MPLLKLLQLYQFSKINSPTHCKRDLLCLILNPLPRDKILDWSRLKAFADDKINLNEKNQTLFGKGRKHCGKRKKCCLPAFSPFTTMFSKAFFILGGLKSVLCGKELSDK